MHIDGTSYLPYPRNKTKKEWDWEAMQMVVKDRERHAKRWEWIEFWKDTNFFSRDWTWILIHEEIMQNVAVCTELEKRRKLLIAAYKEERSPA